MKMYGVSVTLHPRKLVGRTPVFEATIPLSDIYYEE